MGEGTADEVSAEMLLAAARADRARLEFVLHLSHELRTPASVIAGYLSLARQGEIRPEEALDVADAKAQQLCALLDAMLAVAQQELETQERWRSRARQVQAESQRLRVSTEAAIGRARKAVLALESRPAIAGELMPPPLDRRDAAARQAREELATRIGIHPRDVGSLSCATAAALLAELNPSR
jgi:signal transduction histidine kinase